MSKQQDNLDLAELKDKIAIVTGAGNDGIGWGLCKHAAGHLGMHIVAMDLHENLVDSAQERLRSAYPDVKALGIACDVTKPEELSTALSNIERIFQIAKLAQFLPTQAPCSTKRFSRAVSRSGQLPLT